MEILSCCVQHFQDFPALFKIFLMFFSEIPLKEFIRVFWRTWVVLLGPLMLAPILYSGTDSQVSKFVTLSNTALARFHR